MLDWLKLPPWKTKSNFSDTSIVFEYMVGVFCMLNLGFNYFILFYPLKDQDKWVSGME